MPRKLFRKYLPSHQAIVSNPWIAKFGGLLTHHNLWHLNRRSVAGGFAAGLFAGLIPGPLQIIGGTIVAIASSARSGSACPAMLGLCSACEALPPSGSAVKGA